MYLENANEQIVETDSTLVNRCGVDLETMKRFESN